MEKQKIYENKENVENFLISEKMSESNEVIHSMLFGRLTPEQKEAVLVSHESSLIIVAGPGTGKTATITARIIYFLLKGYSPILALTFTRKAANELRNRISTFHSSSVKNIRSKKTRSFNKCDFLDKNMNDYSSSFFPYSDIFVSTIHSFCWKLLKQYCFFVNLPKNLTIIDKETSIKLLKLCIFEINKRKTISNISNICSFSLDLITFEDESDRDDYDEDSEDEANEDKFPLLIHEITQTQLKIEKEVDKQKLSSKIDLNIRNFELEKILKIIKILKYKKFANKKECSLEDLNGNNDLFEIYYLYTKKMKENKPYMLDYTDLIILTLELLNNKEVRTSIQISYPYIFCDEFQDTSKMQLKILELLMKRDQDQNSILQPSLNENQKLTKIHKGGITVVGDDDQAIYSWRGVESGIFTQFPSLFNQNFKMLFLTENFRSTSSILFISNKLVQNNKFRIQKSLKTNNKFGIQPKVFFFSKNMDELSWIVFTILLLKCKYNYIWSDFAILTRTNDILFHIEKVFSDRTFVKDCINLIENYQFMITDIHNEKKRWLTMIPEDLLEIDNSKYPINSIDKKLEEFFPIDNTSRTKTKNTKDLLNKNEILDILSYCRLLVDETADDCFLRICNRPKRGIGDSTFKILEKFGAQGISLIRKSTQPLNGINDVLVKRHIENPKSLNSYEPILSVCRKLINYDIERDDSIDIDKKSFKKTRSCLEPFVNLLNKLKKIIEEKVSVPEIINAILEHSNYFETSDLKNISIKKKKIDNCRSEHMKEMTKSEERHRNAINSVLELIKCSEPYIPNDEQPTGRDCLICFLQDASNGLLQRKKEDRITLSTIHKAKGLEWKVVFIPRFVENIFPLCREADYYNLNTKNSGTIFDEERRIAFVAFTRAKERLFVSVPLNMGKPSPFIQEANLCVHCKTTKSENPEPAKKHPKIISGTNWKY